MSRISLFAVAPLVSSACRAAGLSALGEGAATISRFITDRVNDQSLRVVEALANASNQAWRTLELALVGESIATALDRADDKAFREQVRLFLLNAQFDGRAAADRDFVARCLAELQVARSGGVLTGDVDPSKFGDLTRFADPAGLLSAEWKVADELAADLRVGGFPTLAAFLTLRPAGDPSAVPLLAVAVRHHFRRTIEDDPKLFQGLAFAQLERIGKAQEQGTAQLAELMSRYVERLETRLGELKDTALTTRSEVKELKAIMASGGCQPTVPVINENSGSTPTARPDVFTAHTGAVACIAISPDGTRAVTGGADHGLWVWDLVNRRELRCLAGHRDRVCSVAFSPDGRRVLSSSLDQTVRLWDLDASIELKCFDRQTNRSVAFAPDGKTALCGSLYDGKLRFFDTTTGKETKRLPGHTDWVVCVAFASDGKVALSGGLDKTIKLWDVPTGRLLRTFTLRNVIISSVAFSPDGWRVLSAGSDSIVRGWDTFTGQELFRLVGHTDAVSSVAVSPDGDRAASAGHDGTVRMWDVRLKKELRRFQGHAGNVLSVAFTPDGQSLMSGGEDGTVRMWNVA
ncbi:MAG: WD40 repeat domain-containing protein [Planctomycetes bacterium]|nr:WD40 repeat domain-containing protein [Planctomycetota bacterium]